VFLTIHPPYRPLAETGTLGNVCRARLIASGISRRQFIGSHAYRHALAVRLLRMGQPLKAIGDVLGHRSSESTAVYTKLGIEDLRKACLEVPT
jgi:site-specific recombinase XerD